MAVLFAIAVVSFFALLWACLAIARHVRATPATPAEAEPATAPAATTRRPGELPDNIPRPSLANQRIPPRSASEPSRRHTAA